MSPKKIGRPPKENPRNVNLNIRLTKEEAQLIKDCAEDLKKSRTDVIVEGVRLVKESYQKIK